MPCFLMVPVTDGWCCGPSGLGLPLSFGGVHDRGHIIFVAVRLGLIFLWTLCSSIDPLLVRMPCFLMVPVTDGWCCGPSGLGLPLSFGGVHDRGHIIFVAVRLGLIFLWT